MLSSKMQRKGGCFTGEIRVRASWKMKCGEKSIRKRLRAVLIDSAATQ